MPASKKAIEKGEQIRKLNSEGYTVTEIRKLLNCSNSNVRYHLGYKNSPVYKKHKKKYKDKVHPFVEKTGRFKNPTICKPRNKNRKCTDRKAFWDKIRCFHRKRKGAYEVEKYTFTAEDVINKFGENPKCYLTGDQIDIYDTRNYQFDHIIPVAKGGQNTLDNLGLATSEANHAKRDMTPDQFINLCKKILENNGYDVTKQQPIL